MEMLKEIVEFFKLGLIVAMFWLVYAKLWYYRKFGRIF